VSDQPAALLIPELRWDPDHGFTHLQAAIDDALELGVGGFVIANGPRASVAELASELQRASRLPLLLAAPAESGAGACFDGLTGLPPLGALAALADDEPIRRAARVTARELRSLGITWALGPVLDLAVEPRNPFLGSRSFGEDPQRVAECGVTWIDACQAEGVMAAAMHLPGVGRATADPALGPAAVTTSGTTLWAHDLVPFSAAVDAGVATVLVSQVSYPGLDASGTGAARSSVILEELMRHELQYDGLLVSVSPAQGAVRAVAGEGAAAVAAVAAGCDLVLDPHDVGGAAAALDAALADGSLLYDRMEAALRRRAFWAEWGRGSASRDVTLADVLWARQVADLLVHPVRGVLANIGPTVDVISVNDDGRQSWRGGDGPFGPFLGTLRAVGLSPRLVEGPTDEGRGAVVIAVRGAPHDERGRAGFTAATRDRVAAAHAAARAARRSVLGVLFGPPAWVQELPELPNVVCAWDGTRAMQEAAARRLA
jgi:beta-glucosidase-like glycosyl hydrolase